MEFRRFLMCIVRSLKDSPGRLAHLSVPFFPLFFAAILRARGDRYSARQIRERGEHNVLRKASCSICVVVPCFPLECPCSILALIVPVPTIEMSVSYVICLFYYISDLTLIRAIRMILFFFFFAPICYIPALRSYCFCYFFLIFSTFYMRSISSSNFITIARFSLRFFLPYLPALAIDCFSLFPFHRPSVYLCCLSKASHGHPFHRPICSKYLTAAT